MEKLSFEGIGQVCATFQVQGDPQVHQVVQLAEDGAVASCSDGQPFCGVVLSRRKHLAAVQLRGFLTLPFSQTLTCGRTYLAADGTGGVKSVSNGGVLSWVVQVDPVRHQAVILL